MDETPIAIAVPEDLGRRQHPIHGANRIRPQAGAEKQRRNFLGVMHVNEGFGELIGIKSLSSDVGSRTLGAIPAVVGTAIVEQHLEHVDRLPIG